MAGKSYNSVVSENIQNGVYMTSPNKRKNRQAIKSHLEIIIMSTQSNYYKGLTINESMQLHLSIVFGSHGSAKILTCLIEYAFDQQLEKTIAFCLTQGTTRIGAAQLLDQRC